MGNLDTSFMKHIVAASNLITMGKKYQTRDGQAVRVLCVDGSLQRAPVIGVIEGRATQPCYWTAFGVLVLGRENWSDELDLVLVPTKHEGWMVVVQECRPNGNRVYADKLSADIVCAHFCGEKVVHVTWED